MQQRVRLSLLLPFCSPVLEPDLGRRKLLQRISSHVCKHPFSKVAEWKWSNCHQAHICRLNGKIQSNFILTLSKAQKLARNVACLANFSNLRSNHLLHECFFSQQGVFTQLQTASHQKQIVKLLATHCISMFFL